MQTIQGFFRHARAPLARDTLLARFFWTITISLHSLISN